MVSIFTNYISSSRIPKSVFPFQYLSFLEGKRDIITTLCEKTNLERIRRLNIKMKYRKNQKSKVENRPNYEKSR